MRQKTNNPALNIETSFGKLFLGTEYLSVQTAENRISLRKTKCEKMHLYWLPLQKAEVINYNKICVKCPTHTQILYSRLTE